VKLREDTEVEDAAPAADASALLRACTALTVIAVGYELDRAGAELSGERLEQALPGTDRRPPVCAGGGEFRYGTVRGG
jgi:hypothetical protein